jgi:hypothetical protein
VTQENTTSATLAPAQPPAKESQIRMLDLLRGEVERVAPPDLELGRTVVAPARVARAPPAPARGSSRPVVVPDHGGEANNDAPVIVGDVGP